jgi:hypothetical protein
MTSVACPEYPGDAWRAGLPIAITAPLERPCLPVFARLAP